MLPRTSQEPPQSGGGLADRIDDLILRAEHWPHRTAATIALAAVVVILVGIGWWSNRPSADASIDAGIPMVEAASGTAVSVRPGTAEADDGDDVASADRLGSEADPSSTAAGGSAGSTASASSEIPEPAPLVVHVSGAVLRPGLVTLASGSRVDDAIAAAGGPSTDADVHQLNLAAVLADGTQIVVPMLGAEIDGPLIRTSGDGGGTGHESATGSGPVDLNTAGRSELETLPGIGPATSAAIETWREDNGGFRTVEELLEVPGIGPAKLAAIVDLVTV